MVNTVKHWHAEHEYFNRLLDLLQQEVDNFHTGENPNYELMLDIISYLRDYSDQYHHPREDEAFKRLAKRVKGQELPIARLVQEHRVIVEAGQKLRELLEEVLAGEVIPRVEIEVAAATYLVYFGNHIAREEEEVIPVAARMLTDEDWKAVKAAAPAESDPLFGPDAEHRFKELRDRIAAEAG